MPVLDWIGKSAVVKHHKDVPYRLLEPVPELSCEPGDGIPSGNLIVQGDNLDALKALLPRYAGQVKCIYIDPPYNTGNKGWAYNDSVDSPEIRRWLGEAVGAEGETLDRHDRWLCMMYPRLVLLRQFLRDDGVIFVSIDDNELANLKILMDEVFGAGNFIEIFSRIKTETPSNLSKTTKKKVEYVVAYGDSAKIGRLVGVKTSSTSSNGLLNQPNAVRELVFPGGKVATKLPDGVQRARIQKTKSYEVELLNDVEVRDGYFVGEFTLRAKFKWSQPVLDAALNDPEISITIPTKNLSPAYERREYEGSVPANLIDADIDFSTNEDATAELFEIFGNTVFEYPKPQSLIRYLISMVAGKDSIVMDSFAGSGTTGHAVLKLNSEDGGNRKFILVEMHENVAGEITAERVKRVAIGYINGKGEKIEGIGGGFRFCRLSREPLFTADGRIRADIGFAELAEFVWFVETGAGCDDERRSIAKSPMLGVANGKALFLLYNGILGDRTDSGGNVLNGRTLQALKDAAGEFDGPWVVYGSHTRFDPDRLRDLRIDFKVLPYRLRDRSWA